MMYFIVIFKICNSLIHVMGLISLDDLVEVGRILGVNHVMVERHIGKFLHQIHTGLTVEGRGEFRDVVNS